MSTIVIVILAIAFLIQIIALYILCDGYKKHTDKIFAYHGLCRCVNNTDIILGFIFGFAIIPIILSILGLNTKFENCENYGRNKKDKENK